MTTLNVATVSKRLFPEAIIIDPYDDQEEEFDDWLPWFKGVIWQQ